MIGYSFIYSFIRRPREKTTFALNISSQIVWESHTIDVSSWGIWVIFLSDFGAFDNLETLLLLLLLISNKNETYFNASQKKKLKPQCEIEYNGKREQSICNGVTVVPVVRPYPGDRMRWTHVQVICHMKWYFKKNVQVSRIGLDIMLRVDKRVWNVSLWVHISC